MSADWKWTGPAEPMLHAVQGLRARGHAVDFAAPDAPGILGGLLERARERGLDPVHVLRRAQGYRPLRDLGEVRRLRALFAEGRYDLVHVHHARDHLLARAARRGLRDRPRLVASWHRGEPIPRRPWTRWLYAPRRTDGLGVLSEALAEHARAAFGGEPDRVAVLPGAVDTERFTPREPDSKTRESLGLEPDHVVIGVVARLQPHRRFDLLLEAFARAWGQEPRLRLLAIGRGTRAREVLQDPVRELGLSDAVIAAGYRSADYLDVLGQMRALVFLVPGSDGSCRALLEAMSMRIPAIVSRRGVLPETVPDGTCGQVIDEHPEVLAGALLDVARTPDRWSGFGRAASARVREQHTLAHQSARLESFYASLLDRS